MEYNLEDLHEIKEYDEYTRSYDIRYVSEIRHLGLNTYRILKDTDSFILDNKVAAQFQKWDEQWSKIVQKNKLQSDKVASLNIAEERTLDAQNAQKEIENILLNTLKIDDTVDWDTLKDKRKFKIPNPKLLLRNELSKIKNPTLPSFRSKPTQPIKSDYAPALSLVDKIFPSLRQKKINQTEVLFQSAIAAWEKGSAETEVYNKNLQIEFDNKIKECEKERENIQKRFQTLEAEWKKKEDEYYSQQDEHNNKIDRLKEQYLECDTQAVIEYCSIVLSNSEYPINFPKDFDIDYNLETKMLLIEYVLPAPTHIPTLTDVKFIATKKELKESHLSENQIAKIYDRAIYEITLRTLHEIYEADQANAIEAIVFNGWVEAINKATGKKVNNCIVSIQTKKSEFIEIELSQVDPKTCFKNLKGIGSSKLSGIVAIQPIAQINKDDKRFIASYDVADKLTEGDNLASMDWGDFEHLLREIFAKEFSANGGEVKVTQASRDGGVDAIAFDPDPIRGGKIVIQAKRYTNTVGVSAVRDLYGTVMNEGATKGILVTTTDYGPDAYEFAKNKPISLMNGANLLYLLEKHGHKARIDVAEAKRLQQQG